MTANNPSFLLWTLLLWVLVISLAPTGPSHLTLTGRGTVERPGRLDSENVTAMLGQDPVYPNETPATARRISLGAGGAPTGDILVLTVQPSNITLGPSFSEGRSFNLTVGLEELECTRNLTRFDFYVAFNSSMIEATRVYQGSFEDARWNKHGTFLESHMENTSPNQSHLFVRGSLLSNCEGQWEIYPNGSIILAVVEFKALKQSSYLTYTSEIKIQGLCLLDSNCTPIHCTASQTVLYTMLPLELQGSHIDLYMKHPPLGGQGYNQSADLVTPKTEITIAAQTTYNAWPVQYRRVTFEVRDNHGVLWAILQDDTDDEGHAYVCFRMPWPCEEAEDLLGKWTIIASANIGGVVVRDFLFYDYDYLVATNMLSTDKHTCATCDWIELKTDYNTKAMNERTVVLSTIVSDELGVPVGMFLIELTVGRSPPCAYRNYTTAVQVHIGSFAHAGLATVHVVFMDALPSEGGEAVSKETTTTFYIQPS